VLTFGHINRNKLAHAVLEAIRLNPNLVRRIEYRLVGPIEDDYARELGLAASDAGVLLKLLGRVSDEDLAAELELSDVVCCLRMPALESASASAIESLASGRPTVVVDTGFYSELPDDVVMKIDPWDIVGGLGDVLAELSESARLRSDLGLRGKVYAEETFGAGDYALTMREIASETHRSGHVVATVIRVSRTLFDWGGQGPEEVIRQLLDPLTIFDPEPRRDQPARLPRS
jgi:glycosyltransferase involved in cell wall biosynthesis